MTDTPPLPPSEPAVEEPLISARNVSLQVPVFRADERRLLSNPLRLIGDFYTLSSSSRSITSLINSVTFTLEHGGRLGLIGGNGAGKSTMLRLLAGIYTPTSGQLEVNGVAKGLFDISLGMLPEATGIENIYLRGLQMGLSFPQIKELIPSITGFSELGTELNKPLATFSAGMRLRLAVSISTMLEPDILLLDEWIGTGDARFSMKVRDRILELIDNSRGIVLATHNAKLMKSICTTAMVLDQGRMTFIGPIDDALEFYKENPAKTG